jgi:hypothetical protein
MATAKKRTQKTPVAKKAAAKPTDMKPIKSAFNRSTLIAHLAEAAAVEMKAARALMAALEATMLAPVHKKGSLIHVARTVEGQRDQRASEEAVASTPLRRWREFRRQAGDGEDRDARP